MLSRLGWLTSPPQEISCSCLPVLARFIDPCPNTWHFSGFQGSNSGSQFARKHFPDWVISSVEVSLKLTFSCSCPHHLALWLNFPELQAEEPGWVVVRTLEGNVRIPQGCFILMILLCFCSVGHWTQGLLHATLNQWATTLAWYCCIHAAYSLVDLCGTWSCQGFWARLPEGL